MSDHHVRFSCKTDIEIKDDTILFNGHTRDYIVNAENKNYLNFLDIYQRVAGPREIHEDQDDHESLQLEAIQKMLEGRKNINLESPEKLVPKKLVAVDTEKIGDGIHDKEASAVVFKVISE